MVINMIYILIITFLIMDIVSKLIISRICTLNNSVSIINNFFNITYTHNYGGAWSILSSSTIIITIISFVVIGGIIFYLYKNKINSRVEKIGYALLLGGAIGNLIDRIIYGYVIDFLDFNIFGYNFPIFNIADICIVIGIFIIIVMQVKGEFYNDNKCNRK